MPSIDEMVANGTIDIFGGAGRNMGSPNVPSLGWLPDSIVYFQSGPNAGRRRLMQRFTYTMNWLPINLSTTLSATTTIDAGSDFVWVASNITVVSAADNTTFTPVASAPLLFTLVDTASGSQLMDNAVPVNNWFGANGSPFVNLGHAYIVRRAGQLQGTLVNQSAATNFNVRMAWLGFKVFDVPAQ